MADVITVTDGDVVSQRPGAIGRYRLDGPIPEAWSAMGWKPYGPGLELRVSCEGGVAVVAGGTDGARYRLTASDGRTFDVRVSSTRPITTASDDAPVAGSALARALKR